ncbi:pentapeptide repeat-containing protein [Methanosarcina vacuolata]|uniref:pentapeptide repeat-containing protein n=1 Tax=Methanosarcina vacuolata TaxID=2215 RepID=UPI0018DBEC45|nr:pentapeptide repeat-containing protein [Methanosarcina vacuolata]
MSTVVVLLLSTATQATEYRDVKAEEILKQIENREEVNLTNCHITGEFNVSTIKLETVPNPYFYKLLNEGYGQKTIISYGVNENSSVIKSNITIKNSTFDTYTDFSNVLFNNSVSFEGTNFFTVNFCGSTFNNYADFSNASFDKFCNFWGVNFGNNATFRDVIFGNSANFGSAIFSNNATFINTTFNDYTDFSNASFGNSTNFRDATFDDYTDFSNANFDGITYFSNTHFGDFTDFSDAKFCNFGNFTWVNLGNNTTFIDTIFGNSANFSNANFGNNVNLWNATFDNYTDFYNTTFDSSANFMDVNFGNYSNFQDAQFGDSIKFSWTNFGNYSNFQYAQFGDSIKFSWTNFGNSVTFSEANFGNSADFSNANFGNFMNFQSVRFGKFATFIDIRFTDTIKFIVPDASENIITDGKTCSLFRKNYDSETRYKDADNIYYNYRIHDQERKSRRDISKWIDFICWIICGYGLRPWNAIMCGFGIIGFFSIVYANPIIYKKIPIPLPHISLKRSNRLIPFIDFKNSTILKIYIPVSWNISWEKTSDRVVTVKFQEPAIVNGCNQRQKVSTRDIVSYSIRTFLFMNNGKWYNRDNFGKWVIAEGVLGWSILGILMATITKLIIRI